MHYLGYADDHQIYFHTKTQKDIVGSVQTHLADIKTILDKLCLKLNTNKTILQIFPVGHSDVELEVITADEQLNKSITLAKNLGFTIDNRLKLDKQISKAIQASCLQLKIIARFRNCMSEDSCKKKLVSTLMLPKLNYCATLYTNCVKKDIYRLQKIQNQAARLITKTQKRHHITPVLKILK